MRAGQQWRRTADEQPHPFAHIDIEPLVGQQARVEGGHAHHHCAVLDRTQYRIGFEPGQEHHGRSGDERAVGGHEQPVRVEDGQRVQQHIGLGEAPQLSQGEAVRGQVAMAEHRPFRLARGATGVQDGSQVAGRTGVVGEGVRLLVGNAHERCQARFVEHKPWFGILHQVGHFGGGVAGVHGQQHHTGTDAGEIHHQRVDRLLGLHRHPVARLHTDDAQRMGHLRRAAGSLGVGEHHLPVGVQQEWAVVVEPYRCQRVEQGAVGRHRHQWAPHDSRWIMPAAGRRCAGLKSSPV